MINIVIPNGEEIKIILEDTDGYFIISYNRDDNGKLTVFAEIEDSDGREGIIYEEDFNQFSF